MSRINTNVSSLLAQRVLRSNNKSLNTSLERLSTGLKINKGADNPAGLIASENLRSEKTVSVVVQVTSAATQGAVSYTGATANNIVTIEVAGNAGAEQLSFTSATTI